MVTGHSTDRISKLRNTEYIGLIALGTVLLFLLIRANEVRSHRIVQISYGLVVAQIVSWVAWTCRKLTFLSRLGMSRLSATEVLSCVRRYRLMLMREKLWGGLCALLFLLVPANVLTDYWMDRETPLLAHLARYILLMLPAVVMGTVAGLWPIASITKTRSGRLLKAFGELKILIRPKLGLRA